MEYDMLLYNYIRLRTEAFQTLVITNVLRLRVHAVNPSEYEIDVFKKSEYVFGDA
jgi:hypothetical protein